MAITDKTRKRLWAASGGRCAKCRCRLVHRGSQADGDAVVGDECHIVGRTPTCARAGDPIPGGDMDGYGNLILLCASDHRLIDSQPGRFPTATVCGLKWAHRRWVEQSLQVSVRAQPETVQLPMTRALARSCSMPSLATTRCSSIIASRMTPTRRRRSPSCPTSWTTATSSANSEERNGVRAASRMSDLLRRLGEHGMFAWWGHVTRQWPTPAGPMPNRLAVIEVRRMAQDQELITAHLQDIHHELRRRGYSTERGRDPARRCGSPPARDETDHSHSPRRGRLGNWTP